MDYSNRVLLQQRSQQKLTNRGKWDLAAAGHVDAGEDSMTTIMRELAEEIGIKLTSDETIKNFQYLFCYRKEKADKVFDGIRIDRQFCDNFLVRLPEIHIDQLKLQESEVSAVKLVTIDELKALVESGEMVNRGPVYAELLQRYSSSQ